MTTAVQTVADALLQARRQNETVDAAPLEALLTGPVPTVATPAETPHPAPRTSVDH